MAKLLCEDSECLSWLEMIESPANPDKQEAAGQIWQRITLTLASGSRRLSESCLICRQPEDEVGNLVARLGELLDGKREKALFEPAEPSFELDFERTREGGIRAQIWIDSGNAATGFYRWDAAGVRFYTTAEHLAAFKGELENEFLDA